MIVDISYDLKNALNKMSKDHVALELTKITVQQENDAGYRKFDGDLVQIYNRIREGID